MIPFHVHHLRGPVTKMFLWEEITLKVAPESCLRNKFSKTDPLKSFRKEGEINPVQLVVSRY